MSQTAERVEPVLTPVVATEDGVAHASNVREAAALIAVAFPTKKAEAPSLDRAAEPSAGHAPTVKTAGLGPRPVVVASPTLGRLKASVAEAMAFGQRRAALGAAGAAGLVLAVGVGWLLGANSVGAGAPSASFVDTPAAMLQWRGKLALGTGGADSRRVAEDVRALRASIEALRQNGDRARQGEDIRGLKKGVETLREAVDSVRAETTGAIAQVSGKLDKPDHDAGAKLAQIMERLDRIEKQAAGPQTTGSIVRPGGPERPGAAPAPTASKETTLQSYVLREVDGGVALVEGRNGLREVTAGQSLPGAGTVRAIERRGKKWIVVTSQGIITPDRY